MSDMGITEVPEAIAAAVAAASALGLAVDDAIVLHASNRLAVRLLPSDVVARVAPPAHRAAQLEVDLAVALARAGSPIGTLDPRVAPRVYERGGLAITLWTHYDARPSVELPPAAYALALSGLHAGMRRVELPTPQVMDRVREAEGIVENAALAPAFTDADRDLLLRSLTTGARAIGERGDREQLLHGEPHPGNVLNTASGPRFIDLETCCRGPLEFDLAHVPEEVSEHYPGVERDLVRDCRILVLAMVAAWRLEPGDQLPSGRTVLREVLAALHAGPPYPAPGAITGLD